MLSRLKKGNLKVWYIFFLKAEQLTVTRVCGEMRWPQQWCHQHTCHLSSHTAWHCYSTHANQLLATIQTYWESAAQKQGFKTRHSPTEASHAEAQTLIGAATRCFHSFVVCVVVRRATVFLSGAPCWSGFASCWVEVRSRLRQWLPELSLKAGTPPVWQYSVSNIPNMQILWLDSSHSRESQKPRVSPASSQIASTVHKRTVNYRMKANRQHEITFNERFHLGFVQLHNTCLSWMHNTGSR